MPYAAKVALVAAIVAAASGVLAFNFSGGADVAPAPSAAVQAPGPIDGPAPDAGDSTKKSCCTLK